MQYLKPYIFCILMLFHSGYAFCNQYKVTDIEFNATTSVLSLVLEIHNSLCPNKEEITLICEIKCEKNCVSKNSAGNFEIDFYNLNSRTATLNTYKIEDYNNHSCKEICRNTEVSQKGTGEHIWRFRSPINDKTFAINLWSVNERPSLMQIYGNAYFLDSD